MNPSYYVTPEEAQKVIDFLNANSIGGGVDTQKADVLTWTGPVYVPQVQGKQPVQLTLNNGTVMNAGLVLSMMSKGYAEWFTVATLRAIAQGR